MLRAIVLTLTGPYDPARPPDLSQAAHAWFMEQVQAREPALARAWHAPNRPRPFTVAVLPGPQSALALRLTGLTAEAAGLLADLAERPPPAITLNRQRWLVQDVATQPGQHPEAGASTWEALISAHALTASPPPRSLTLRFVSPTSFRRSPPGGPGQHLPLPLPELVFGGLLGRWNAFAPMPLPVDLRPYLAGHLLLTRYRLKTRHVRFSRGARGALPAFVGQVTYSLSGRDRYRHSLVHLLAAFAFWSGVGVRTAMGLGQVRVGKDEG